MKLFLDSSNLQEISKLLPSGIIDGVTTNPSLLAAATQNPMEALREICEIVDGPVSIEVTQLEPTLMLEQARKIAAFSPNVVVKIPFGEVYLPVIKALVKQGIMVNVTLVFSAVQALAVFKLGAHYVSPFLGRLDAAGEQGLEVLSEIIDAKNTYDFTTQVIASSIRTKEHVYAALSLGCDIVTLQPSLLQQLLQHKLTDAGIKKFSDDWGKVTGEFF